MVANVKTSLPSSNIVEKDKFKPVQTIAANNKYLLIKIIDSRICCDRMFKLEMIIKKINPKMKYGI